MLLQMAEFHSFLWLSNITGHACMCVCYIFISLSVDVHLGCFHLLAFVNNAAMNIEVHESFLISVLIFFWYTTRSGIARLYGSSTFGFLRNLHTTIHSGCTN